MADLVPPYELLATYKVELQRFEEFTPLPGVAVDYLYETPQGRRSCQEWPGYDCLVRFFAISQSLRNTTLWENITAAECNRQYRRISTGLLTDRGSAIFVVEESFEGLHVFSPSLFWKPNSPQEPRISYCLSQRVPFRCRLQVHIWFLITVIILNAIKIFSMTLTLLKREGIPLITLGDAISSFLERPCPRSAGLCLHSGKEIERILEAKKDQAEEESPMLCEGPKIWQKRDLRYHSSIATLSYWTYIALYVCIAVLCGYNSPKFLLLSPND